MRADLRAYRLALRRTQPGFLDGREPIHVARAPARLDVMGGVADYSGSLVLEATTADATIAGVQLRDGDRVRVRSEILRDGRVLETEAPLEVLLPERGGYEAVRRGLGALGLSGWQPYVLGAWSALRIEGLLPGRPRGARVFLRSTVPISVGLASSAALEVSVMFALASALGVRADPLLLARLCQKVENLIAGAPCGVMDQVAVALGREGAPVAILCQPHEIRGHLRLPSGLATFGLDSAIEKHTGGSPYRRARVAAFMGLKILSSLLERPAGGGYLANVGPAEFRRCAAALPSRITGEEFLRRHGETDDPVTSVDPSASYSVRGCTEHPIYENRRVARFVELLSAPEAGEAEWERAGALMYASHWSYTHRCGLGHRDLTRIVRLARALGPGRGIYGAKITGGGAGGTVALLARADALDAVEEVADAYRRATGRTPIVFSGTSPGAAELGPVVMPPQA